MGRSVTNPPRRTYARAGAAALLQLGVGIPAAAAATEVAFARPTSAEPNGAPKPTNGPFVSYCSYGNSSHRYAKISASYSGKGLTSGFEMSKGVLGGEALFNLPGHKTNETRNFVDQEMWLITTGQQSKESTWIETGAAKGLSQNSRSVYDFFHASKVPGHPWISLPYASMYTVPYSTGSYQFKFAGSKSPHSNTKFTFTLTHSPFHAAASWTATSRTNANGPYYWLLGGTESTCANTTVHEDNWWDTCTGTSHDCQSGGGPNLMYVGQKIYDKSTSTWTWEASWQPSSSTYLVNWCSANGTIVDDAGVPSWCKFDIGSTMLLSHDTSGSVLTDVWSGQHT
jgi:hypothetical protein